MPVWGSISGLPDFRGSEGFWAAYPALGKERISFENIANHSAFTYTPSRAWGFYGHRLELYRRTVPHAGFEILREIGSRMENGCFVFTSNVDGQFQKAGFDETRIVECHGSIHSLQCFAACTTAIWQADELEVTVDEATCTFQGGLPGCPYCGRLARPNILLFNDWSWLSKHTDLQHYRLAQWLTTVQNLVIIELGAGTAVPSVRTKSQLLGAPLIRINPTAADVSGIQAVGIQAGALHTLRLLQTQFHL